MGVVAVPLASRLFRRIRYFLRRDKLDRDLDEEIRFHIEKETEKNVRAGMSPREARRAAMIAFGGVDRHTEGTRQARGTMLVEHTLRDVELALRGVRRSPGFSLVVVLTLGLGTGAVTAVFGMANQIVFRPLPGVANTSDAVFLRFCGPAPMGLPAEFAARLDGCTSSGITYSDLQELRNAATLLDGLASYAGLSLPLSRDGERPVFVSGNTVTGDFFEVLGVRPARGRLLHADETGIDANPFVVVISERLWATHFGMDVDPIGRTLILDGLGFRVVGVAGGAFAGLERSRTLDVWLPHSALIPLFDNRTRDSLLEATTHNQLVGLPAAGASLEAVEAQLADIVARLGEGGSDHQRYMAELEPALYTGLHTPVVTRDLTRNTLAIFGGIGAIALLISYANVAGLLLMRNISAGALVAVRRAIGASSGRIARQHITGSVLFGLLGTVAGLGVAWLILHVFQGLSVRQVELQAFSLDWRVLAFAGTLAIGSTAIFGTLPAALAGRFDLDAALRSAGRRSTRRESLLSRGLSAAQIALTLTLVVGAALLTNTLRSLYAADLGLSLEGVSELGIRLLGLPPPSMELDALAEQVAVSVAGVPGVDGVAVLSGMAPYVGNGGFFDRVRLAEAPETEPAEYLSFGVNPGWFEFFGVETLRGRTFLNDDRAAGFPKPVVVTSALSVALFGGIDVIGRRILIGNREPEEFEVIGVVDDIYGAEAPTEPRQAFFVTLGAHPTGTSFLAYVRARDSSSQVAEGIQSAVEAVVPDVPLDDPVPVSIRIDDLRQEQIALRRLLTLLSGLTVLLSAIGLYGVVSYDVARRRREFGIRSAVGARRHHLIRLVAQYAKIVVLLGGAVGLVGAYALARALENRLFEVGAFDPASYLTGLAVLGVAATLACLVPSMQASRVDLATVLRHD
jgi:putative ABC transport system permease protein